MASKEADSPRHLFKRLSKSSRCCCSNSLDVEEPIGCFCIYDCASRSLEAKMDEEVLKEFHVPKYILVPDSKDEVPPRAPSTPVIVFINSKSGGQLGGDLLQTYRQLLSEEQVIDLGQEAPDKVLYRLYANLERLKSNGDILASEIENKLRLIVAGGDGTAGWLLGVVSDLKLTRSPPIATVPLGTGNNLPFSFGWGKKNPGTDRQSVEHFLGQVMKAREIKIDSWHIIMRMRAPIKGSCDPIAPLELPHYLHAFHRVSHTDSLNVEGYHTFRGGFWNYFSMGMDAQVSYAFHSERKLHPERFKNQLVNQALGLHVQKQKKFGNSAPEPKTVGTHRWYPPTNSSSSLISETEGSE